MTKASINYLGGKRKERPWIEAVVLLFEECNQGSLDHLILSGDHDPGKRLLQNSPAPGTVFGLEKTLDREARD